MSKTLTGRLQRKISQFRGDPLVSQVGLTADESVNQLGRPPQAEDYNETILRAIAVTKAIHDDFENECVEASYLLHVLYAIPQQERKQRIEADPGFHTLALCKQLCEKCHEQARKRSKTAIETGRLAVATAERLSSDRYDAAILEDQRARAYSLLANAHKANADFDRAMIRFEDAARHLARGTGDPLEEAHLRKLMASHFAQRSQFEASEREMQRCISIYRRAKDSQSLGQALISLGTYRGFAGRASEAIESLRRGVELIDPEVNPRLFLIARNNLIEYLFLDGRDEEAIDLLESSDNLYKRQDDPLLQVKRSGLDARAAYARGNLQEAEEILVRAKQSYCDLGMVYDAAEASLEIAMIFAEQGRFAEMRSLAEEMLPVFTSRKIHREALAALVVFRQAVEAEKATTSLIGEVAQFLQKARHNPKLCFEGAG